MTYLSPRHRKASGSYYTPDAVVGTLIRWAVRSDEDRLLDPACGDGRFIAAHRNSVGIEQDSTATQLAMERAPWALVHEGDFFAWATETSERFDCAAGNPPFIRYQTFKGDVRNRALELCSTLGADFSGLSSSWAPFLVAAASLLKPGGRMAFVVPAEIGHAPYAAPLLEYLGRRFSSVQVVAFREKLFPELSEDCWLLYADGFCGRTNEIRFTGLDTFRPSTRPPRQFIRVHMDEWRNWNRRLRPFLVAPGVRDLYLDIAGRSPRFGQLANIGIGYVSGANDFFHLTPSAADRWGLPSRLLKPSVRNGKALPRRTLGQATVEAWKRADEPVLLLNLPKTRDLPASVRRYLSTSEARAARQAYKCRVREPWYSVPDVREPDFFLSYMSGLEPNLVRNDAGCTCTNSVHAVVLKAPGVGRWLKSWGSTFVQLSCELEGHPLGGGMLKLEPGEATRIILPDARLQRDIGKSAIRDAVETMRRWRHYAPAH